MDRRASTARTITRVDALRKWTKAYAGQTTKRDNATHLLKLYDTGKHFASSDTVYQERYSDACKWASQQPKLAEVGQVLGVTTLSSASRFLRVTRKCHHY
jgi:hypothetical protein